MGGGKRGSKHCGAVGAKPIASERNMLPVDPLKQYKTQCFINGKMYF